MGIFDRVKWYKGVHIHGTATSAKNRYFWVIRSPGFDRRIMYNSLKEAKTAVNERLESRKA